MRQRKKDKREKTINQTGTEKDHQEVEDEERGDHDPTENHHAFDVNHLHFPRGLIL